MIYHVVYFQLKPEAEKNTIEELVRTSRSLLLKIPEVLSVKSGRNLDPNSQWQFFFSIEVGSLDKLKTTVDDPYYIKLVEKYLKPSTSNYFAMDYELDPSKDLKYS
jgi:hypothetical protein